MTIDELEVMLDELMTTEDENLRAVKLTDIKLGLRDYQKERDDTEVVKDGEINSLREDIATRDDTIAELRTANSTLAERFSKMAMKEEGVKKELERDDYEIDDLIKRFD